MRTAGRERNDKTLQLLQQNIVFFMMMAAGLFLASVFCLKNVDLIVAKSSKDALGICLHHLPCVMINAFRLNIPEASGMVFFWPWRQQLIIFSFGNLSRSRETAEIKRGGKDSINLFNSGNLVIPLVTVVLGENG